MLKLNIHELKILPIYFEEVIKGNKTFEIRKDDRDFNVGDILLLKEYDPDEIYFDIDDKETHFSGKKILRKISYILKDIPSLGLKQGYVLLAVKELDSDIELKWKSNMVEWGEIYNDELGKDVMTYYPSGMPPYDTITNPFINEDGEVYFYKFDQDEGYWQDGAISLCDAMEWEHLNEILWY